VSFQYSEIPALDSRQCRKYISKLCRYTMGGRHFDALIFASLPPTAWPFAVRSDSTPSPPIARGDIVSLQLGGDIILEHLHFATNSALPAAKKFPRMSTMTKARILALTLASALTLGYIAFAQPQRNIAPGRHPNLAAAQRLSRQAFQKIVEAQQANEWDLQGHAQKAKDLLDQASNELKLAAEASNHK
jgi:hypothetical protein